MPNASTPSLKAMMFPFMELPLELRQRIYFFALATTESITVASLGAYCAQPVFHRFVESPLLPPLANVSYQIRAESFLFFLQANCIELAFMRTSVIDECQAYIDCHGLDTSFARNVRRASMKLAMYKGRIRQSNKLAPALGGLFNIRELTITVSGNYYGYLNDELKVLSDFLLEQLSGLKYIEKLRIDGIAYEAAQDGFEDWTPLQYITPRAQLGRAISTAWMTARSEQRLVCILVDESVPDCRFRGALAASSAKQSAAALTGFRVRMKESTRTEQK